MNFSEKELRCGCAKCNKQVAHKCSRRALEALQLLRECYGKPMPLTSAYRCAEHPVEAKRHKPGRHNEGIAFDVRIGWGRDRMKLLDLARGLGFNGVGFGNTFIHLDWRGGVATCWGYD